MAYRLEYSTWLEEDGVRVLGEREAEILRLIREKGSLTMAAEIAGMSYRQARDLLRDVECAAGARVVATRQGGSGSALTERGEMLLTEYECRARRLSGQIRHLYRNPSFSADGIVIRDDQVLLVRRGKEPFAGRYALPGGFMELGESAEECVVREVEEETGLRAEVLDLIGAYTRPDRDPRGHICTLAYRLTVRGGSVRAGDDASEAAFFPLSALPELAFDHRRILEDALRRCGRREGQG
ncbi:MAG: NUDIX domain-containing protein [Euryarchaeota archaeon]|nr:NUDIX domain-containing protein [Euryarchaeota archaeon]